jgi:hypothetical protein
VLTAADYAGLVATHPNFIAVKASVSDPAIIRDFMALRPRLQFFFTDAVISRHGGLGRADSSFPPRR